MPSPGRVALGWLVLIGIIFGSVFGFIFFMKWAFSNYAPSSDAFKVIRIPILIAIIACAGLGLWLREKITSK